MQACRELLLMPTTEGGGSLAVGKLADLIVLDRDPLVNIRHTNTIRYMMKNGALTGNKPGRVWQ